MNRTVLATIAGARITADCATNHAAHVIAAALSKAHDGVLASVWCGATPIAVYSRGLLDRTSTDRLQAAHTA